MTKSFLYNRLQIHLTEMFHMVLSYRGLRELADLFVKVLDSLGNQCSFQHSETGVCFCCETIATFPLSSTICVLVKNGLKCYLL